ncbi:MAG: TonB-dependent receptor [Proteobacteria bacterium]|nr:TonB-dependent receptor [Pseudomonadota bacterium]
MVRFISGGCAAVLTLMAAGETLAQTTKAPAPAGGESTTLSDIVIESVRPGVVRRIDRTSYDIRDDPQAKAASLIDILGKLPSVSVGADGQVRLLGTGGVTVQFDGKSGPGTTAKLNALTGADVERIEVITNPSSQVSAQGTGGVINIIMRKRQRPGWSGTAGATFGTDVRSARLAPNLTLGKWTFGGIVDVAQRESRNTGSSERTYLGTGGAPLGERTSVSRRDQDTDTLQAQLKATYRPTDKQSVTVSLDSFDFDSDEPRTREVVSRYASARSFSERTNRRVSMSDRSADLSYEREGPREGETLKLNANFDVWRWDADSVFATRSAGSEERFTTRDANRDEDLILKLDYERPLGPKCILTTGGAWTRSDHEGRTALDNPQDLVSLGPSYARRLDTRRDTAAAYATVQFPVGGWTVLPGLRLEDMRLDLTTLAGAVAIHDTDLFPSLHVSKDVAKGTNLKFSYSRRVDRPDGGSLDPTVQIGGLESAWSGNPNLKPTFTDAYEIKLARAGKAVSLDLTVYERDSRGEITWTNQLTPAGLLITRPENAGRIARRGGEVSARGPLGARLKYVVTANLFQQDGEVREFGVVRRQKAFSYSGSVQLDYKSPAPTGRQPQQIQLSARLNGPGESLQSRYSGSARLDLTWRRPLTRKVMGVLTVTDLLATERRRNSSWGDAFVDVERSRFQAPRVRLALTYQIGDKP